MTATATPHKTPGTGRPRGRPRGSRTRHSFNTPGSIQRVRSGTSSTHRRDRSSRTQQAQSDPGAYKPREERSYKEFHPDFDIEFHVKSYDSREIDGQPMAAGTSTSTPGRLNGIQIRVEEIRDSPSTIDSLKPTIDIPFDAAQATIDTATLETPLPTDNREDGAKVDEESQTSSHEPHDLGQNPLAQTPTRRSSRQKDNKEKEREKANATPKSNSARPLLPLSNIHHNERLSLPVPSYKSIVPFQLTETYVDRAMAGVGFQESDYWQRPNTMVRNIGIRDDVKEGEAKISSLAEDPDENGVTPSHNITPGTVEYDMDEQDDKWLAHFNMQRKSQDVPTVTREIFEITITKIEKEWYALEKMIPKQSDRAAHVKKGNDDDEEDTSEDSKCQICDDGECENSNAIVFCDGCDIAVHQDCYGVPFIPEGQWLCRKCSLLSPRREVNCIFCPNTEGAFKMTDSALWSHLLCAIWIPEVTISNMVYMEPVEGVELVPKSRWKLHCYICKQKMGACIQCSNKNCYLAFHVTCARKAKLYLSMRQQVPTDPSGATAVGTERSLIFDGSQLKAFCDKHVPTEWRKEFRTDIHIRSVQRHFERNFYDREWGDSQMKALTGPSAFSNDPTGFTGQKLTLTVGGKRKRPSSGTGGTKVIWRLPSGAPIIPNVLYTTVLEAISRFSVRKPKEYVAEICKYWSLKREARRDASLLKRLQAASSNFTSDEVTKKDYSSMVDGEEKLKRRLDFAIKLRHDLERLRLLVDDIKKREKEKLKQAECLKEMIDTVYFPATGIIKPILERVQQLDSKDFFKTEFNLIKQKINDREYNTVSHFSRDILHVLTSSVTSRSKFAVNPSELVEPTLAMPGVGLSTAVATPAAVNSSNPFENIAIAAAAPPIAQKPSKSLGDTAGKTAGRILRIVQPMLESAKLHELAMREDPNERMAGEVDERYQEIVLERKKREELEAQLAPKTNEIILGDPEMDKMDIDNPSTENEQDLNDRAAEAALESATVMVSQSQMNDVETDGIIGIPWYTKPFSPMGATLLSEERWMGLDVVRDMSPLSELDEDEVEKLQTTALSEPVSPLTEIDDESSGTNLDATGAAKFKNESLSGTTSTTSSTRASTRSLKGTKKASYLNASPQEAQQGPEHQQKSLVDNTLTKSNRRDALRKVDVQQVVVIGSTRSQTKQALNKAQRRGRGYVWVEVEEPAVSQNLDARAEENITTDKDPDAMDIDSEPPTAQAAIGDNIGGDLADPADSIDSPLTSIPDDELDLGPDDQLSLDHGKPNISDGLISDTISVVVSSSNLENGTLKRELTSTHRDEMETETPGANILTSTLDVATQIEAAVAQPAEEMVTQLAVEVGRADVDVAEVLEQNTGSPSISSPSKRSIRISPRQKDAISPIDETKSNDEIPVIGNLVLTPKSNSGGAPLPMTTRSRRVVDVDATPSRRGSNRSTVGKKR